MKEAIMKSSIIKFSRLGLLILLTIVTVGGVVAVADSNDSNIGNNNKVLPTDSNSNTGGKEVLSTLGQRMQKRVSVDFRNTPIDDVIRIMAEQSDVDIIKSPKVTGEVTATLTNVPLEEALNNILISHGYGYVASNNMIRILPLEEMHGASERLVNRIYRITYANVCDVEAALKKFISQQGSLSSNPGTSNIIVTDTESKIKAIDTFIEEVDRITPQILVEARIYDVTTTEGFDIGTEWQVGRNDPVTTIDIDEVYDTSTGVATTDTTTKETKTAWMNSVAGLSSSEASKAYTYRKSKPFVGGWFDPETSGVIRLGFLDAINLDIALSILRTQIGAKLLANPRILVLDNETAEFEIISEIPYTEASETSTGGSMTSICFKKVGTKLKVIPHVTREGMIRLQIVPEFGVVTEKGLKTATTALGTVPTVDTRKVDTKALIRDGQTVVLGGLRKRTVTQTIKKIPLLGDAPLVGQLFTDETEEVKTNELLIFITPKIVVEPTLSPKELKNFEATEFAGPEVTYTRSEQAEKLEKQP